jgi:hypothetical protein
MAQVAFSTSEHNKEVGGLWHMPAKNYTFTATAGDDLSVDFFALDTNGVQNHVRRSHPGAAVCVPRSLPAGVACLLCWHCVNACMLRECVVCVCFCV